MVDQLQLQISELAEQRDLERRRADRTETARQQLDVRLHEALETAKSAREDWTEYVRSVENRALSDVDRARQEVKELQVQQSKASEQHRALEKQLRQDIRAAQSAAATTSQSADILRGKCDTPFRIMYIMFQASPGTLAYRSPQSPALLCQAKKPASQPAPRGLAATASSFVRSGSAATCSN